MLSSFGLTKEYKSALMSDFGDKIFDSLELFDLISFLGSSFGFGAPLTSIEIVTIPLPSINAKSLDINLNFSIYFFDSKILGAQRVNLNVPVLPGATFFSCIFADWKECGQDEQ